MSEGSRDKPRSARPWILPPLLAVQLLAFMEELAALERLARDVGATDVADALQQVGEAAALALDAAKSL